MTGAAGGDETVAERAAVERGDERRRPELSQIRRERLQDGRYLIYYTFEPATRQGTDQ